MNIYYYACLCMFIHIYIVYLCMKNFLPGNNRINPMNDNIINDY